jgi:hypothetical protein
VPTTDRGNPLLCADNFEPVWERRTPQNRGEPFASGPEKDVFHTLNMRIVRAVCTKLSISEQKC